MAGLVALVSFEHRPQPIQSLAEPLARLASPVEERSARWSGGTVALAATALAATTADSSPLAVEGRLAVVVDARFDDRRGLAERLCGLGAAGDGELSAAGLVLAAYRQWGVDCLRQLSGDFAFVLWDGDENRLFAARDAVGVRQLVWARDGDRFILASSVGAVVAALGRKPEPNWSLLRDQIARGYDRWLDETCFAGIHRLPPAHRLLVVAGRPRTERWTRLGEDVDPVGRSDAQHVAAFGEALAEAVRSRLEGPSPVGLLVSGGLDSSSLACLAEREIAGGLKAEARLYSMVFENTPGADETEYREAVLEHCPHLEAVRVPSDERWALCEFGTDQGFPLDEPERELTRGLVSGVARRAVADGCGALLGGHWGDQVLGSGAYGAASAVADVSVSRLRQELPHFRRHSRYPGWVLAAYSVVSPLVAERLRRSFGGRGRGTARSRALLPAPPLATQSARLAYYDLTSGVTAASLANLDRTGRWLGFEWRFPYLDRKVIEAALGLPAHLRFAAGMSKVVLRSSLVEILPERVLRRRGRAYFDDLIERGLRFEERGRINELLDQPRVVERGLLAPSSLANVCSYFEPLADPVSYRDLASLLCVEAWMRHHLQPSSDAVARDQGIQESEADEWKRA